MPRGSRTGGRSEPEAQAPAQQQPGQPQQPVYRPNVAPPRPSYQPPQQPYVQQQRFPATQFQPAQPRTVINPNAPTYRAPRCQSERAEPLFEWTERLPRKSERARADVPAGSCIRAWHGYRAHADAGHADADHAGTRRPINGAQGAGQSALTAARRSVFPRKTANLCEACLRSSGSLSISSPPGKYRACSRAANGQRQSKPFWRVARRPKRHRAAPLPTQTDRPRWARPRRRSRHPLAILPTRRAPPTPRTHLPLQAPSPSNMGPTAGATDMAPPPPGGGTAGAPVGPPPASQTPLNILAFPSNLSASGGGAFQPTIYLNGSGFTTMTQIVWTCTMPSGQACTSSPYNWTPSAWSGKYVVNSDTSAMVAPHLLAGGDPAGVYQWTVSFVGNGGKSFVFQVNNAGSAAPPPAPPPPPPPVTTQPPPPPVASNPPQPTYPPPPVSATPTTPPPPVPSGQAMYIESGTGTQLTADQIRSGTFPPGTFFIQSGTGQQVTQAQLLGTQQVSNNNPPVSQPVPPPLPPSAPAPVQPPTTIVPVSATLRVSGVQPFYSSNGGPYQPFINLSGGGFNSISQIVWTCVMPTGQSCTASPYVWTPATWNGKFSRYSDNSALVVPVLLAGGDPGGTYQWTVSFFGNGQASFAFQVSNTGVSNVQPPQNSPPQTSASPSLSSLLSASSQPPLGNMSSTTPSTCLPPVQCLSISAPDAISALDKVVQIASACSQKNCTSGFQEVGANLLLEEALELSHIIPPMASQSQTYQIAVAGGTLVLTVAGAVAVAASAPVVASAITIAGTAVFVTEVTFRP